MDNVNDNRTNIQTVCVMVLTGIAVSAGLFWLRDIMIPFVLAVFCSLTVQPLVDVLKRKCRVPRIVGLLIVLIIGLIALCLIWSLVSVSISQMSENSAVYEQQFDGLLQKIETILPDTGEGKVDIRQALVTFMQDKQGLIGQSLVGLLGSIMNLISKGVLVLIFMMFMLAGEPKLSGAAAEAAGGDIVELFKSAKNRVQRYLVTKLVTSATTGLLVGLTLWLLGVPMAIVFGLLAFLLNFIPSIGSVIATVLPLPVVVMTPEISAAAAVAAIAIPGAIQFTIGNIVEPRVMGKSLGLHPVAILLALIFWGALWGIIGMLLATPITATLKIFFEKYPQTKKLAWLMGES